mmetsp:Transcript_18704/g.34647  ORF Transcript_18704/g.34647 Transcript_18704/m.34647 type:complete len:248 (-) Transcript_18704:356-1099(-)
MACGDTPPFSPFSSKLSLKSDESDMPRSNASLVQLLNGSIRGRWEGEESDSDRKLMVSVSGSSLAMEDRRGGAAAAAGAAESLECAPLVSLLSSLPLSLSLPPSLRSSLSSPLPSPLRLSVQLSSSPSSSSAPSPSVTSSSSDEAAGTGTSNVSNSCASSVDDDVGSLLTGKALMGNARFTESAKVSYMFRSDAGGMGGERGGDREESTTLASAAAATAAAADCAEALGDGDDGASAPLSLAPDFTG